MERPIFTISLDFELHWGRFDKYPVDKCLTYYSETRKAIPKMLAMFESYGVHATWAAVGGLMADNLEEWRSYSPDLKPTYVQKDFSAYHWVERQQQLYPDTLFAPELVREIIQSKGQEFGCHTYSHYYTCEKGQQSEQFRADLKACQRLALEKFDMKLETLVFPRNQYDHDAIHVASEEGFGTLRSNPEDWFWRHTERRSLVKKLFRTGDTLISMGKDSFYPLSAVEHSNNPVLLPTSRLLRPFVGNKMTHQRRISRIKSEMQRSAEKGMVYHLWWHPHNFGHFTQENLHYLQELLAFFQQLRDAYGMVSLNMKETAGLVRGK
ncbi:polysaccharide deacetylase family protein [Aquiflexum gelatinilyticum]|uniref:polysaccharide deacetylase family protein n=1 Tax=Aquiflexum gelatinilyticum TaxID=2961943 RepID=UPI002168E761|nr:polysaccharide deacetylase family protein [Aquiflexum gelatinilyticum]MCS4434574.1 polysaccharide deacetylase family protein [Aquiflexum gelatinilyticum]